MGIKTDIALLGPLVTLTSIRSIMPGDIIFRRLPMELSAVSQYATTVSVRTSVAMQLVRLSFSSSPVLLIAVTGDQGK